MTLAGGLHQKRAACGVHRVHLPRNFTDAFVQNLSSFVTDFHSFQYLSIAPQGRSIFIIRICGMLSTVCLQIQSLQPSSSPRDSMKIMKFHEIPPFPKNLTSKSKTCRKNRAASGPGLKAGETSASWDGTAHVMIFETLAQMTQPSGRRESICV